MLVSVIIPAYNREKSIAASVRSVLDQTWHDLELIVVDDCSSDSTVDVIRSVKDERIRLICSEKNGGACAARNRGIDEAKGEVIAFQDSDDIWHADKLAVCMRVLTEKNADFVFSERNIYEEHGQTYKKVDFKTYNMNEEKNKTDKILVENCISTQTLAARREVFEKIRFDTRFPRFQDWDLAIQIYLAGWNGWFIEEPLVDCFVQGDSISSDPQKAKKAFALLEDKYRDVYAKRPEVYQKYCARTGFALELFGTSGQEYFRKEWQSSRNGYAAVKYILSKTHLYAAMNPDIRKNRKNG